MTQIMLFRALRAEVIKVRRTLALVMILLAPLAVDGLLWLILMRYEGPARDNGWQLIASNMLFAWNVLMMPLFITLETALLGSLDHNASGWKHLFALPIPRWTVYMAKQIITLAAIGMSSVVLCVGLWLVGMSAQVLHLKPNLNFNAPFPWTSLLSALLLGYLAAWLIIAIHTFAAMRWPSFVITIGIGMAAVMGGVFGANNQDWAYLYPWTLPAVMVRQFTGTDSMIAMPTLLYGLIGGLVIMIAGCWYFSRRNIQS
ncbi:MAG TPA: ABC transporter permease [Aggregatilineales bacterium]|nr:ABC transporter permease [Aggregatilineales bacterium]